MIVIFLLFTSNVMTQVICNISDSPPKVTTKYGEIEGLWRVSYEGRRYALFEGIPYAKPPVGDLRFEDPQPIAPWSGTWRATNVNRCIQRNLLEIIEPRGDEDCLYLNIYVPTVKNNYKKLDVVVHIHGGGFVEGHSRGFTNESYIMDRDVIFATMHYRLDAFGFLSTGDDVVPGNMGLKDQSLAMEWIKENIESFGGNSESITLTGFSAGAASVHYHYLSPMSQNLFNRGMSMSGSALDSFALQNNPQKRAEALARSLRCDTTNKRNMVNCMKSRPAHLITRMIQSEAHPAPLYPYIIFAPVIEHGSKNPFITKHPYEIMQKGEVFDVPWIVSVTLDEGALLSIPLLNHYDNIDRNWTHVAKYLLDYDEIIPEAKEVEIAERIRDYYIPKGQAMDKSQFDGMTKMWSDRLIVVDNVLSAQMQSKANKSPVYFYQFGYAAPHSLKTLWGWNEYKGVPHGDDTAYFFGGLIFKPLSAEETEMKNIALDILYSYANTGIPSMRNITWTPVGKEFNFLNISGPNNIKMAVKTDFSSENFWRSLGLLENENIFPASNKTNL